MQKRIIALALASLVSGATFAQSNVTIYGIADMNYVYFGDATAPGFGSTNQINSGQWKTSRFGLKGSEDLGNGLSAVFQMEFGLDLDVNGVATKQRPSWVGLQSKSMGELKAGNFNTFENDLLSATSVMFEYNTLASPKYVYLETTGGTPQNTISNAVHYYSPKWSGFQVKAGVSTHGSNSQDVEAPSGVRPAPTTANNRIYAAAVHYSDGPLVAGATYEHNKYQNYPGAPSIDSGNTWNLAAAYDFGVVRISAAYGTIDYAHAPQQQSATKRVTDERKQWQIGVSAPITPKDLVSINYARANVDYANFRTTSYSDDSIGFWGVGYRHSLSKRTTLYAAYGDINQNDSNYTKSSLNTTSPTTPSSTPGFQNAFTVGMRHDF